MKIQDINYIVKIAEHKSISKAAEILYITQPSLSRSINRLEQYLGLKLFQRKSDGIALTEAGTIFVRYGKDILYLQHQMEQELKNLVNKDTQTINIAMTLNASYMSISKIQESVRSKYPNYNVQISNIRSVDIEAALYSGKFNFAVGPEVVVHDSDLKCEIATEEYFLLLVPNQWDFSMYIERRDGLPYPWLDLGKLPSVDYIMQEESSAVRRDLNSVLEKYGIEITPTMVTINSTLAIQAVERQLGCCFSSEVFLPFIGDRSKVQTYCVGEPVKKVRTCLISLKNKRLTQQEQYCMLSTKKQLQEDYQHIAASEHQIQIN